MTDDAINAEVNDYISDNFSPKKSQREYITEKYQELKGFLGGVTFRSGSYARYTAVDPVHDLDVIYPVTDVTVEQNPQPLVQKLMGQLEEDYKKSPTKIKRIYAQTHSITIELADSPEGNFSIDVVPAVAINEKNKFGDPLYMVPEILRMNRHNRTEQYIAAAKGAKTIGWVKTDPRGYVTAAANLNDSNENFRHAVKLVKSWRHAAKMAYRDKFKLKSFHLEQIVHQYFDANPGCTTVDAAIDVLASIPNYLRAAQIPDRADAKIMIDDYVNDLTAEEEQLILRLQSTALTTISRLPAATSTGDIESNLTSFVTVTTASAATVTTRQVIPSQPWSI